MTNLVIFSLIVFGLFILCAWVCGKKWVQILLTAIVCFILSRFWFAVGLTMGEGVLRENLTANNKVRYKLVKHRGKLLFVIRRWRRKDI